MENEVEVNEVDTSFEPKDYFAELKGKLSLSEASHLAGQLQKVGEELLAAKALGLKNVVHKLSFLYKTIIKEQTLLVKGFDTFVYKDDILAFIDKIEPKNSVKIVELERYPRLIPTEAGELIKTVRELEVFDKIFIIFTDFTEMKIVTKEEKAFVAKNRDPIAFGAFANDTIGFKHDRFYLIADWEDEYCDLTFSKMIEKMSKMGMQDPTKKISFDHNYVNTLAGEALEEIEKNKNYRAIALMEKASFADRIIKFIKKLKK